MKPVNNWELNLKEYKFDESINIYDENNEICAGGGGSFSIYFILYCL